MRILATKTKYHELVLDFPYNEFLVADCRKLKEVIGWKKFNYDGETKSWAFDYEDLHHILKAFPRVDYSEKIAVEYTKRIKAKETEKDRYAEALEPIKVEGLPLFPYQEIGVNFASTLDNVLIADEMGLGKTLQAIGVIENLHLTNVLIICPASLRSNWQNEVKQWTGKDSVIVETTEDILTTDSLKILNYAKLLKFKEYLPEHDLLVFDESHYLKNPKTKRTRAAKQLASTAKKILLLTGTPILNRPEELVSQLEILGKIKEFKSPWAFMMRYCDGHKDDWGHWNFSGASELLELKNKLKKFTLRRVKQEVLKDLPDKLVHSTYLDMPEPDAYKKVAQEVFQSTEITKEEYKEFYKAMYGMNPVQRAQYLDGMQHNEKYKQLTASTLVMIEKMKQESIRQKLLILPEILLSYVDSKKKVVVFATHKSTVRLLEKRFRNICVTMDGDTKIEDRQGLVDKFQNDPSIPLFFGTIKTAGMGFTLTAANDVIFAELDWTPTAHQQAEDRCYRIGQDNTVNVNYLILKNSIDEDIVELLMEKTRVIEGTIRGQVLHRFVKHLLETSESNENNENIKRNSKNRESVR